MSIHKGCKKGVLSVKGENVYKHLKHESGVHKVQRVPETEKAGRIHSSTAIVVVMPEVPRDFTMDLKDIRFDYMRAGGPGGQHVNKTDSACRATHTPTGICAVSQEYREQQKNKDSALNALRQKLYQVFAEASLAEDSQARKDQIGTGNLGEKIRTYNWPNNRITDHRTGEQKFGLDQMLDGTLLEEFITELIELERSNVLDNFLKKTSQSSELQSKL